MRGIVRIICETKLEVEFDAYPAEHGARGKYGERLEPDYPASIEILCISPILSVDEQKLLKKVILDSVSEKEQENLFERYEQ